MRRNTTAVADAEESNMIKEPDDWKTGDEEIADEAGEEVDLNLTKAEASKKIEELLQKTGRGVD